VPTLTIKEHAFEQKDGHSYVDYSKWFITHIMTWENYEQLLSPTSD